jgi:hypothetical protein
LHPRRPVADGAAHQIVQLRACEATLARLEACPFLGYAAVDEDHVRRPPTMIRWQPTKEDCR